MLIVDYMLCDIFFSCNGNYFILYIFCISFL
jgi:hypothetical protein